MCRSAILSYYRQLSTLQKQGPSAEISLDTVPSSTSWDNVVAIWWWQFTGHPIFIALTPPKTEFDRSVMSFADYRGGDLTSHYQATDFEACVKKKK